MEPKEEVGWFSYSELVKAKLKELDALVQRVVDLEIAMAVLTVKVMLISLFASSVITTIVSLVIKALTKKVGL